MSHCEDAVGSRRASGSWSPGGTTGQREAQGGSQDRSPHSGSGYLRATQQARPVAWAGESAPLEAGGGGHASQVP